MSTLGGQFVSSSREREKRGTCRRDSRDEREGQGRKRKMIESEETEEIKTFFSTLTSCKNTRTCSRPCPTVSQYQLEVPGTVITLNIRTAFYLPYLF